MQLERSIIAQLASAPWLRECGKALPAKLADLPTVLDEDQALSLFSSTGWADARRGAQGDLTGYLSKHHYSAYGGYWNQLVKKATKSLEGVALEPLRAALRRRGWADAMSKEALIYPRSQLPCSISADCSADEADDLRLPCLHREEEADAA